MHDTLWSLVDTHLSDVPSTDTLFNPYATTHPILDRPQAAATRRANLRAYLEQLVPRPRLFLLLEAPGPWGCRFTGVPITSEAQLLDPSFPLGGQRTSRTPAPHTEYSASIFWRTLQPYAAQVMVWNSVPLHPHDAGAPLSIRTPRRREVARWDDLTRGLLDAVQPERVVGVGRKAERALRDVGADPTYVRHPSQGGAKKFAAGMTTILDALQLERTEER
ncbi:uracil-DNA glycosylase [Salisaeta longa]|uniref:uracil-DNA glycosylase n=1 Tax=Salisaeta longa TaxID=503170 RepID=UPI0003B71797|nr:uracil-DNA glycosylase [Salisaeta longa]